VVIRPARPDDVAAIAVLFRRSFGGLGFLPTLHTPEEDLAHFARLVDEEEAWVAETEGGVVAFATLDRTMLNNLYVDPPAQGHGIGTALLEHAKRRRPGGFRLWTFQRNDGARRFYERHGFDVVKLTDGSGNEEHEPDLLYEWRPATSSA
jgi:GNAT superfamily N-acetyltransferase